MLTEPNYRGHRIEVYAELSDGHWDATVRIRRLISEEQLHVERVPCRKVTAGLAETRAAIWAKRWVDQHSTQGEPARRPA
jgi:hypothetical protein